jgi:hypothetical protein
MYERRAKIAPDDHRTQRELPIRESRGGREDAPLRPVIEVEERRELLLSHRPMLSARTMVPSRRSGARAKKASTERTSRATWSGSRAIAL